ncbi:heavy metal translocating P-type ATPase [Bacteroides sp.]|uniref:heavy metal translocating P-type ATPase n=1 Tax=Bacteroides sp. TaxID=29523 RepID=UPI00262E0165|nr:heavy metal translocating P-type ATPase [Bacteroides sp.]MDD3039789.1 heavy metal translocating P-type ATPase [Bacteroides sp.]
MKEYRYECFSFLMLIGGILASHFELDCFLGKYDRLVWYIIAILPVGLPVLKEALESLREKDFANEFMLMSLATIGAFIIGEYPEGVAVMLFYAVGEKLQESAVDKARDNIRALLDMRPQTASVQREGKFQIVSPAEVQIGETIEVKVGERVPLDGTLQNESVLMNTAALTGESVPRLLKQSEEVLAGMIPSDCMIHLTVNRSADQSALSRVLAMVEEAAERKAPTEVFMRKIARIYTPVVMGVALLIMSLPFIYGILQPTFNYVFADWLYKALVFLVIACPCALVVSIPLGYFGGIGAASRRGILFKGGNYLDAITKIDTVVFDKTGTLTTGKFKLDKVIGIVPDVEIIQYIASAESQSTHPMAKAVVEYAKQENIPVLPVEFSKEMAGYGLETKINGQQVVVGNYRLLDKLHIAYPMELRSVPESLILCARDQQYIGCAVLVDELKEDAHQAIQDLKKQGIRQIEILSGDKDALVQSIARKLEVDKAYGDLLPGGKVEHLETLKREGRQVAFVGDGINDAPVLALSDVGVAMGALGSDIAIETADVVIQNDHPSQLATAIKIGKYTHRIVWQNITFAFVVKIVILILGTGGLATLWEAVFADSGVALLSICNAMRIGKLLK